MSHKTQTEKDRIAVDITTKNLVENARRNGLDVTESAARRKAVEIAERATKKREENK